MTVFITYAPADGATAEQLEKFVERRGHFVEMDDGHAALRPVQASDAVVLLMSKDFVFSPHRLRLEQRALDAWSEGRLILVKLDHGIAPVGLRDLPSIDASFEAQREFTWQKVSDAIREAQRAPRADGSASEPELPPTPPSATKKKGTGLGAAAILFLLALPGCVAIAATAAIWLVNRIGPTPGTSADLLRGIDEFGTRYGVPSDVTQWIFLVTIIVTLAIFGWLISRIFTKRRVAARREAAPAPAPQAEAPIVPQSDAVFVSYASANATQVLPVIDGAEESGAKFWVDRKGIGAGEGWAGEIVRAIRGAPRVLVMCSKAAFESDHVKREIYLADRYHKRLLPVFIEDAEPPEDFEYFFAGVQFLKLFETPEAERPAALAQALGA